MNSVKQIPCKFLTDNGSGLAYFWWWFFSFYIIQKLKTASLLCIKLHLNKENTGGSFNVPLFLWIGAYQNAERSIPVWDSSQTERGIDMLHGAPHVK